MFQRPNDSVQETKSDKTVKAKLQSYGAVKVMPTSYKMPTLRSSEPKCSNNGNNKFQDQDHHQEFKERNAQHCQYRSKSLTYQEAKNEKVNHIKCSVNENTKTEFSSVSQPKQISCENQSNDTDSRKQQLSQQVQHKQQQQRQHVQHEQQQQRQQVQHEHSQQQQGQNVQQEQNKDQSQQWQQKILKQHLLQQQLKKQPTMKQQEPRSTDLELKQHSQNDKQQHNNEQKQQSPDKGKFKVLNNNNNNSVKQSNQEHGVGDNRDLTLPDNPTPLKSHGEDKYFNSTLAQHGTRLSINRLFETANSDILDESAGQNRTEVDDDLTESERDYKLDYEQCLARRLEEQSNASQEKKRLAAILDMCERLELGMGRDQMGPGCTQKITAVEIIDEECQDNGYKSSPTHQHGNCNVRQSNTVKKLQEKSRENLVNNRINDITVDNTESAFPLVNSSILSLSGPQTIKIKTNGSLTSPGYDRRRLLHSDNALKSFKTNKYSSNSPQKRFVNLEDEIEIHQSETDSLQSDYNKIRKLLELVNRLQNSKNTDLLQKIKAYIDTDIVLSDMSKRYQDEENFRSGSVPTNKAARPQFIENSNQNFNLCEQTRSQNIACNNTSRCRGKYGPTLEQESRSLPSYSANFRMNFSTSSCPEVDDGLLSALSDSSDCLSDDVIINLSNDDVIPRSHHDVISRSQKDILSRRYCNQTSRSVDDSLRRPTNLMSTDTSPKEIIRTKLPQDSTSYRDISARSRTNESSISSPDESQRSDNDIPLIPYVDDYEELEQDQIGLGSCIALSASGSRSRNGVKSSASTGNLGRNKDGCWNSVSLLSCFGHTLPNKTQVKHQNSNNVDSRLTTNPQSSVPSTRDTRIQETCPDTKRICSESTSDCEDNGEKDVKFQREKSVIGQDSRAIESARENGAKLESLKEEELKQMEVEWDTLESELHHELSELRLEEERMDVIKQQQMELLLQGAREKEETKQQIVKEREELEKRERQHEDTCKLLSLNTNTSADLLSLLGQERDALDIQRKLFEDLEFHLLELETKHDVEREPVQQKLSLEYTQLMQSLAQRQMKLNQIAHRKQEMIGEFERSAKYLEKERGDLVRELSKNGINQNGGNGRIDVMNQSTKLLRDLKGVETDPSTFSAEKSRTWLKSQTLGSVSFEPWRAGGTKRSRSFCVKPNKNISPHDSGTVTKSSSIGSTRFRPNIDHAFDSSFSFSSDVTSDESSRYLSPVSTAGQHWSDYQINLGSGKLNQSSPRQSLIKSSSTITDSGLDRHAGLDRQIGLNRHTSLNHQSGLDRLKGPDRRLVELDHSADSDWSIMGQDVLLREKKNKVQGRPMTRYLPVKDRSLDLRQFTELSGHLLDHRSHVTMTSSTCKGQLSKLGGRFRTWHRRWFVFDRLRRTLSYYADRSETRPRRVVPFRTIQDVFVDHLRSVRSPNPAWTFCLKTTERVYFLVALSAESMRIWIDVLFTGAEGYREYEL